MSVFPTWAAMFEPERFPPPPVSGLGSAWRYGLAMLGFLLIMGAWVIGLEAERTGFVWGEPVEPFPEGTEPMPPVWFLVVDGILGALCLGVVHLRRRWPLATFLGVHTLSAIAASSFVVAFWTLMSLSSRRDLRKTVLGVGYALAVGLVSYSLPWTARFRWPEFLGAIAVAVVFALWGMWIGVRRDRAAGFLRRVEQAEADRAFAVLAERNRIAREMHDVLAHRISLVSMHAGVLAYRSDLDPEKTREIAQVIQENAHASLTELRSVLSTLREVPPGGSSSGPDAGVAAPQPTLADLPVLLAEARNAGQALTVHDTLDAADVGLVQQRHLYRIMQECLTNARKHAPRSGVEVLLFGTRRDGITLRVCNEVTDVAGFIPGAKLGLVGITERAQMLGGRLDAGVQGGRFVVEAWLPWETDFRRNP